jgi:hypothetical protein
LLVDVNVSPESVFFKTRAVFGTTAPELSYTVPARSPEISDCDHEGIVRMKRERMRRKRLTEDFIMARLNGSAVNRYQKENGPQSLLWAALGTCWIR